MRRIDIIIRTSMVRYITLGLIFVMAFAFVACDATSNPNEGINPSESPSVTTGATSGEPTGTTGTESTGNPATTDEPIITADPTGTAQTAEPTNSTVEPTKVPTPTPTAVAQPTADPAIYNDNWGYSDYNNTIRTNGQELFWTKTRHLVKIPKELQNLGFSLIDAKNEQGLISVGFLSKGTLTYYALRDGVFYKLNQGKIVKKCFNGYDAFGWVEEDGTACSIGVRSKYWNEVYIEGTNCIEIGYMGGKLIVVNQSGKVIDVNKEDTLRESIIVK